MSGLIRLTRIESSRQSALRRRDDKICFPLPGIYSTPPRHLRSFTLAMTHFLSLTLIIADLPMTSSRLGQLVNLSLQVFSLQKEKEEREDKRREETRQGQEKRAMIIWWKSGALIRNGSLFRLFPYPISSDKWGDHSQGFWITTTVMIIIRHKWVSCPIYSVAGAGTGNINAVDSSKSTSQGKENNESPVFARFLCDFFSSGL